MIYTAMSNRRLLQPRIDPPWLRAKPFVSFRTAGRYTGSTLTLVEQSSVYPARVQITLRNLAVDELITVSRSAAGSTVRTAVRGANEIIPGTSTLILIDAEQPFGVELTYWLTTGAAVDEAQVDVASANITVQLAGGKVALSDAITGVSAEVVVLSWPSKRRTRPSSVFPVAGRNIVVTGTRGGFESTIEFFTETTLASDAIDELLQSATAGIVQIRQAGPYDDVDSYFVVQSDDKQRYSQDGSDERRIWAFDVIETAAWAPTAGTLTFDLDDVNAAYPGTLIDLNVAFGNLLALAQGDFS